jgi:hypothetical protein
MPVEGITEEKLLRLNICRGSPGEGITEEKLLGLNTVSVEDHLERNY